MLLWWTIRLSVLGVIGLAAHLMGGWMKVVLFVLLGITAMISALTAAEVHFEPKSD